MKEDCIFCKIIAGEIPSKKVFEDQIILAILDINPISEGHSLIIPKKHIAYLEDADEITLGRMTGIAGKIAGNMIRNRFADGTNLFLASHESADQTVFHIHLHVIPRRKGDKMNIGEWWKEKSGGLEEVKIPEILKMLS
jgi:histidine triad (HIT) family protein